MSVIQSENRSLRRALAAVEAHRDRTETFYQRQRSHHRNRGYQRVHVYLPSCPEQQPVSGCCYDVSRSGLGFVCESTLPHAEAVFCVNPGTEIALWMQGEIRRCKPIFDGVHDYGVKFTGRAEPVTGRCLEST
ncbi:MAG: PilZ domain-containing protein [Planctomycetota bacterium]|jgi:hypothetical protein